MRVTVVGATSAAPGRKVDWTDDGVQKRKRHEEVESVGVFSTLRLKSCCERSRKILQSVRKDVKARLFQEILEHACVLLGLMC